MAEEAKSCGFASCDLALLDGLPLCFNLVTFLGASTPFRGLTLSGARLDSTMKSRLLSWALLACIATGALALSGCSTISSRIDSNRAAFDQLSPEQRALVSQGSIQGGMSQEAVYIAWGQPQGKAVGMVRGVPTETWVYTQLTAAYGPYGYGGFGPGWGYGWGGYAGRLGFYGRHGRFRYYGAFVDPYWNPYYYPFAGTVSYPVKTVSFQRGRVVAFQLLTPSAY